MTIECNKALISKRIFIGQVKRWVGTPGQYSLDLFVVPTEDGRYCAAHSNGSGDVMLLGATSIADSINRGEPYTCFVYNTFNHAAWAIRD